VAAARHTAPTPLAVRIDIPGALGVFLGGRALAFGLAAALVRLVGQRLRARRLCVGLALSRRGGLELPLGLGAPSTRLDAALRETPFAHPAARHERRRQQHEDDDDEDDQERGTHDALLGLPLAVATHAGLDQAGR
jgi:hypothetical protein